MARPTGKDGAFSMTIISLERTSVQCSHYCLLLLVKCYAKMFSFINSLILFEHMYVLRKSLSIITRDMEDYVRNAIKNLIVWGLKFGCTHPYSPENLFPS